MSLTIESCEREGGRGEKSKMGHKMYICFYVVIDSLFKIFGRLVAVLLWIFHALFVQTSGDALFKFGYVCLKTWVIAELFERRTP